MLKDKVCPECGLPIADCNARVLRELDRRAGRLRGPLVSQQTRIEYILNDVHGLNVPVAETAKRILRAVRDDE